MRESSVLQVFLALQGLATFFLICLFWGLYTRLRRKEFFWWWSVAWSCYGVFLVAGRAVFIMPGAWPVLRQVLLLTSVLAGFAVAPLLVFGVLSLRAERREGSAEGAPRFKLAQSVALLLALGLGAASFAAGLMLGANAVDAYYYRHVGRYALMAVTYLYCAYAFMRWASGNRSLGGAVAAVASLAAAIDQFGFLFAAAQHVAPQLLPVAMRAMPDQTSSLGWYLLDLSWEMGIGLAMVLLLLEDHAQAISGRQQTETKFAQIFAATGEAMVITSLRDDRIVEANEAFTKLAGYERSEVVGKRASDIQLWANTELRQQVMEKVTQGIPVADFEAEFRARNGQTKVGLITVTPLRVEGEPCVLVMGRDITDRRNAEQQLRDRTGILNALIENNPLAIVVIDEGERIQLVNAAFESLFRYKRDEAIGKRLDDLIAPQDLREEAFGYSGSLLGGKNVHATVRRRRRDGGLVDVELYGVPMRSEGKVVGGYAIYHDITSRRLAEELLRESEERYRDLFENASDLVFTASPEGALIYVNRAWLRTLGYQESEMSGLTVDNIVHTGSREVFAKFRERAAAGENISDIECVFVTKDGRPIEVEGSCGYRFQDKRPVFLRAIFRDVTARKQAQEEIRKLNEDLERRVLERTAQLAAVNRELEARNREVERANRLKSQFLASMSHELRTPLNAVIGFSDLLNEETAGPLNDKQKRYVEHVLTGARNLLQLINDILDLSKVEAGQLLLRPESFPLAEALPEVLSTIKPLAMNKQIQVESRVEKDACLRVDRVRLKQVLYNLLSNAIKFTAEGGRVVIEARRNGESVCVSVADNGIGIPPEEHEAIFNEFHQVGMTTKGVREGTGLGLAISRRLVEAHEGKIWVESTPGHGSKFSFTVPAGVASEMIEADFQSQRPLADS